MLLSVVPATLSLRSLVALAFHRLDDERLKRADGAASV
jgi:hypothetical protein